MNKQFKELSEQLRSELQTKEQYDRGDLALTSNQLDDLYTRIRDLTVRRLNACTHDKCQGVRDTNYYQDEYGCGVTEYHIRVVCLECDQQLLDKMEGGDYHSSWGYETGPLSLREACIWWDKQPGAYSSPNAKKIEDYGVRRIERRVVEYV